MILIFINYDEKLEKTANSVRNIILELLLWNRSKHNIHQYKTEIGTDVWFKIKELYKYFEFFGKQFNLQSKHLNF